ncbi:hypothetical protein [Lactonifactor longoviformis]|uniref:hypothetical protein n=1 Tax=Lactonifactor longoviformis TaxID=341220 RepID=UPI0034E445E4
MHKNKSNAIAGLVKGLLPHLEEHIAQKKTIYGRYKEGFKGLSMQINPFDADKSISNFWLSCMIIDPDSPCVSRLEEIRKNYM